MEQIVKSEPIISTAFFGMAASAIITLFTSFGLDLNPEQTASILGAVNIVALLVVALVGRGKVTPNSRVVEIVNEDGQRVAGEASPAPTGMVLNPNTEDPGTSLRGGF